MEDSSRVTHLRSRSILIATTGVTAVSTCVLGILAVRSRDLLHVDEALSAGNLPLLVTAALLAAFLLLRPGLGLVPLVVCIFLNLSEVLVRFHGLPSLLQFAVLPLALGAWWEGVSKDRRLRMTCAPLTWLLTAYSVVLLLSTLWAVDLPLSDRRVLEVVKALALYALVAALITGQGRLRQAVWSVVASAGLLAGLAMWQVATARYGDQFGGLARIKYAQIYDTHFEPRIAGPLGDPNFFAQILCLAVPLALALAAGEESLWRRWAARAAAALVAGALVFTYSRGASLALLAVMVLWTVDRGLRPSTVAVAVALLLTAVLLVPDGFARRLTTLSQILPGGEEGVHPDSSFEERKLLARSGWEMFRDHPLFGVGAANYAVHFAAYADEVGFGAREYGDPADLHYAHNLFLEIATETGLLGLAAFGLVMGASFRELSAARLAYLAVGDGASAILVAGLRIALTGYLVSCLFLHGHYLRYLWLVFALVTAAWATSRLAEGAPPEAVPELRA